jgi:very-short-patch-repair endonuclease
MSAAHSHQLAQLVATGPDEDKIMADHWAYMKSLRLAAVAAQRERTKRLERTKHLYVCDLRELDKELLTDGNINIDKTLRGWLRKRFKEGVDYEFATYPDGYGGRRCKMQQSTKDKLRSMYQELQVKRSQRPEEVTISQILEALPDGKRQFGVRNPQTGYKYRVDLYYWRHKIAVECDEHDHPGYVKDRVRQENITEELDCKFLRYNPHAKDFDINNVIAELKRMMADFERDNKMPTPSSKEEHESDSEQPQSETEEELQDQREKDEAAERNKRILAHVEEMCKTNPEFVEPAWLDMLPRRECGSAGLWYLTPYGLQPWPYPIPYGIYAPSNYVQPKPIKRRPPGAAPPSQELIDKEAAGAAKYNRGPWPDLPHRKTVYIDQPDLLEAIAGVDPDDIVFIERPPGGFTAP